MAAVLKDLPHGPISTLGLFGKSMQNITCRWR